MKRPELHRVRSEMKEWCSFLTTSMVLLRSLTQLSSKFNLKFWFNTITLRNLISFAKPPYPNATTQASVTYTSAPSVLNDCGDFMFQNTTNSDLNSQTVLPSMFDSTSGIFGSYESTTMDKNTAYYTMYPIHDRSFYKSDLDKHLRRYLAWQISATSSVLHLRNVTGGLIITDCTFDSNIGLTGSALFVKGFDTNSKII